jgi:Caspase domain
MLFRVSVRFVACAVLVFVSLAGGAATQASAQSIKDWNSTSPPKIIPSLLDRRVALVIGNSAYRNVGHLRNPSNDAELIGAALRRTGIEDVTVAHDLDRDNMVATIRAFARKADAADWAIVYYAGHGIEINGTNYLLPVDAKLETDRDVPEEAVSLDQLQAKIAGARKLKLIVLDACRNNPFMAQMKMTVARRSVTRGFTRFEPAGATLVVYAAKEGTTAVDGDGLDSPFALSFAKRIVERGIEINKALRFVRQDVLLTTGSQQEPFVYGSLPPDDFYFLPPAGSEMLGSSSSEQNGQDGKPQQPNLAMLESSHVNQTSPPSPVDDMPPILDTFPTPSILRKPPPPVQLPPPALYDDVHSKRFNSIEGRDNAESDWAAVKDTTYGPNLESYIRVHKDSSRVVEARERLELLQKLALLDSEATKQRCDIWYRDKVKSVGILTDDNSAESKSAAQAARSVAKNYGLALVLDESFAASFKSDHLDLKRKLRDAMPSVVYSCTAKDSAKFDEDFLRKEGWRRWVRV